MFLSAMTLLEISHGVTWLEHRGASAKAARLSSWLDPISSYHLSRILPVDAPIA